MRFVGFEYRNAIKTPARTKTILLLVSGTKVIELEPVKRERSKTGAHGWDYYYPSDIDSADAIVHIDISNSGKHYCEFKKLKKEAAFLVLKWLEENEHVCPSLAKSFQEKTHFAIDIVEGDE
jgi:hypothetical protein